MRRILLICVVVQVVLGCLASKVYLTQHNTIRANGRWTSSKTQLEKALMGSFAFVTERQSLAGGQLNLGAWHGFQEVVFHRPVAEIESIEFDFQLAQGANIVALFGRTADGSGSGVRLSTVGRHPSAFLRIASNGKFDTKRPFRDRTLEPDTWQTARLVFEDDRVTARVGDRKLGSFAHQRQPNRLFGFRGGSHKPVLLDNIRVSLAGGKILTEDFDTAGNLLGLTLAVSATLIAFNLGLFVLLSRLTRRNQRVLGFSFLMVNLTVLALGAVLFIFVLLRAGSYPGLGRALSQAEEAFGKGTVEQVAAEIHDRHALPVAVPETIANEPYRILFLGTSQTWGAGARQPGDTFVAVAEELLNANSDSGRSFECINAGFSSLKAADLVPILKRDLLPLRPHVMFVNLGTNDRPTRSGFVSSVREMAEAAQRAGTRTVLIQEANEPGSMVPEQLARFAELDQVGAELGLQVIDMHSHLKSLQDTGFLWWDLVHLTDYGQRLVAERLVEELERLESGTPAP